MFDGPQSAGRKMIWSIERGVTPRSFPGVSKIVMIEDNTEVL